MVVKQALCHMTDVILLHTIISLEVIKEIMEVRKVRLVRTNVFGNVRSRERATLEGTRQSAVVRRMIHVRQGHKDLEVLGQALDGVDLEKCQPANSLPKYHRNATQFTHSIIKRLKPSNTPTKLPSSLLNLLFR